ncbi:MAG: hypothetical protein WAP35_04725 [Solirubrobacterales bacterium]
MGLKKGKNQPDADGVIDAELADTGEAAPNLPVPRAAALPEATEIRAIAAKKDGEIAVRSVAVATAGGLAVGAATVVLAKAVQTIARPPAGLARRRGKDVVASRSFLVDVHLLRPQR